MDRHLMIKELAPLIGVNEDTVINWELRGVQPTAGRLEKVREALGFSEKPASLAYQSL